MTVADLNRHPNRHSNRNANRCHPMQIAAGRLGMTQMTQMTVLLDNPGTRTATDHLYREVFSTRDLSSVGKRATVILAQRRSVAGKNNGEPVQETDNRDRPQDWGEDQVPVEEVVGAVSG